MRLAKRLLELAFVILVISLFMKNKDIELQIDYFGLSEPLKVAFWELVTFCVSLGIIIAAVGDFMTQLKWSRERRRMIKTDREHQSEVGRLSDSIRSLETENQRLKNQLEQKSGEISDLTQREETTIQLEPSVSQGSIDKPEDSTEKK
jgi:hypothetical protein